MKVRIDAELCTGHGRCAHYGPDVYRLDDDGFNVDAGSIIEIVSGFEKQAIMGMKSCPERAITVVED